MPGPRLTISPTRTIVDLLESPWPLRVPKHRLMRLALQLGLQRLSEVDADEFRRIVTHDAVQTAGIEAA